MPQQRINQEGFSVTETLLLVVIVAIIAGVGYFVYHAKQTTDKTLTAPSTQIAAPRHPSRISVNKTKLPPGWKVGVNSFYAITMGDSSRQCSVFVSQTDDSSLKTSNAQAFINQRMADDAKSGMNGTKTIDSPLTQLPANTADIQGTTAAGYSSVTEDSKGQVKIYGNGIYVIGDGYYIQLSDSCTSQSQLPQADQALLAITIKP